jgi:hypothetical protein
METGEFVFGTNHGKLSHLQNLAPKIIYAHDCRSMMKYCLKEKTDIRYKKVWGRKKKQEEKLNEENLEIVLTRFAEVGNHDESTCKEEDIRIQKDDPSIEKIWIGDS